MDVSLASLLKFLHVVSAFLLVAGLVGRAVTLGRARRTVDLREIDVLLPVATRFERIVIPGSAIVFVLGILTMLAQERPLFADGGWWLLVSILLYLTIGLLVPMIFLPRGKVFEAALEEARARGAVTPELHAAFADPLVAFARTYEIGAVGVILALMVLKPF
ncbi:MAG TPA: DUF2269 family protein [Actinomycetota bacterium]